MACTAVDIIGGLLIVFLFASCLIAIISNKFLNTRTMRFIHRDERPIEFRLTLTLFCLLGLIIIFSLYRPELTSLWSQKILALGIPIGSKPLTVTVITLLVGGGTVYPFIELAIQLRDKFLG